MLRAAARYLFPMVLLCVSPLPGSQELKIPDTPERLHIAPAPSDRFPAPWYPRVGDGTDVVPAPVLELAYTATVETMTPYQSPTGETLRQVTKGFQARDRLGRTRIDTQNGGLTIQGQPFKTKAVFVYDPVTHCQFRWTQLTADVEMPPEMRLAFVTCGPQTLRYKEMDLLGSVLDASTDGTSTRGDTTTKTEHLAPLQVEGLSVGRLRVTNTRLDEHGQVKTWTAETWYSPELRELIRLGTVDDGYTALTGIDRKEPDPKLFYPPDGYRIEPEASR